MLVEVGEQEAASNQCGGLAAELGDMYGRPLVSELGIGVAGLTVGITRTAERPLVDQKNSLGDDAARVSPPGSARKAQESSPPFGGRSRGAGVGLEGSRACRRCCVRIHKSADIFCILSRLGYQDFQGK